MRSFILGGGFLGLALLGACGVTPITSVPGLMRIDPVTTDFTQAYVMVRVPEALVLNEDSLELVFDISYHTGESKSFDLPLSSAVPSYIEDAKLGRALDGYALYVFGFEAEAIEVVNSLRPEVIALRENDTEEWFSVGMNSIPESMCLDGGLMPGDHFSAWIKTEELRGFTALINRADIATALGDTDDIADLVSSVPSC